MREKAEKLIRELKDLIDKINERPEKPDIAEKRKQLQAIEKSVQQLQKIQVAIPDELRQLKTKLVSELDEADKIDGQLGWIAQELIQILKGLGISVAPNNNTKIKTKRATGEKTESSVLRKYIIEALKYFGNRATMHDVLDWMEEKLKDRLTPRDLSLRKSGEIVWKNNTQWERFTMTEKGILKSDSPHGIWELGEGPK